MPFGATSDYAGVPDMQNGGISLRVLYYDIFCGISGDMNLGALIDLGVDPEYLKKELSKLRIDDEFSLEIKKGTKKGISGTKVDVILKNDTHHHEQNSEVHHNRHNYHEHGHSHDHEHGHHHGNGHSHGQDHHHHHERDYKVIKSMIENSDLGRTVKDLSIKMFYEIAAAEAKVHDKTIEDVHFHEVGAVDSIVDIVGSAICLDALKVDRILASPVQVGGGFVMCDHGKMPVPAPATAEILRGIPIRTGLVQKETTTPTGAVILKVNVSEYTANPSLVIEKTGYGLGTRDLEVPNVTRVFLGTLADEERPYESLQNAEQVILETNIDDMNAELYAYVEERLFDAGALDVYKTPIIMKKGRPAIKLTVLIQAKDRDTIIRIIFTETTSGGVREYPVMKYMMTKKYRKVSTEFGDVQVKDFHCYEDCVKSKAEYEDCARLARENQISIRMVYDAVARAENK